MIHPEIVVTALNDEYDYTDDSIDINEQIFYYLITLLRLSMTCPYIDIRQSCKDFLIGLKVKFYYKLNINNPLPLCNCLYVLGLIKHNRNTPTKV